MDAYLTRVHTLILREICSKISRHNMQNSQAALEEAMPVTPVMKFRQLRWGTKTGEWLTWIPSTVNEAGLGGQE